jgi:hypothetical protein
MIKEQYFKITSVHRDDLEERGFDTSKVDDAAMERLARKMADAYVENCFWDDLETIADIIGIPRRECHDMCEECGSIKDTWRNGSGEIQCDNCGWSESG